MKFDIEKVFRVESEATFSKVALEVFQFQAKYSKVYSRYLELLKVDAFAVSRIADIPFLPIELFKTEKILTGESTDIIFASSGTTGSETSKHFVLDVSIYEQSFKKCFELFYGDVKDYCILALLPSYLERQGSSLVYMMDDLIKDSAHPDSGFYLHDHEKLYETLQRLKSAKQKTWLIGVSYALLDFVADYKIDFPELIVVETGGMKGRREEITRDELHGILKKGFGLDQIHSEYGMTELLSQAYSTGNGRFRTPPWMKVIIRPVTDPMSICNTGETGLLSIIDLANIYSCSFITTADLGKLHNDGSFEILGRADFSDIRGCNLMIE